MRQPKKLKAGANCEFKALKHRNTDKDMYPVRIARRRNKKVLSDTCPIRPGPAWHMNPAH
uniref:Uncharacterized protein n=1 Tax=Arundo donax TaxID=35708 RepID=A0A0A9GWC1_ARUDO